MSGLPRKTKRSYLLRLRGYVYRGVLLFTPRRGGSAGDILGLVRTAVRDGGRNGRAGGRAHGRTDGESLRRKRPSQAKSVTTPPTKNVIRKPNQLYLSRLTLKSFGIRTNAVLFKPSSHMKSELTPLCRLIDKLSSNLCFFFVEIFTPT